MASEGQTAEEGGDGAPSPWRVTGNASALSDDIQRAVVAMKGALAPHFGASDAASVPQIVAQYALFARSEHARRAGAPEEPGAAALLPEGVRVGGWAGMFRPTFCCSEAVAAEERTYLQALYWGLRAPCTLTRRFVPLGNADGAGGQFVLWLPEEALEGHDWDPEAPGVAPVVYLGSEGETSVVAASFRGFVAWQCAPPGLDMDSFRLYAAVADAEEEEDEEEEGDPEARARFLEWAAVCGVHAIPDMATAAAYTLWSREVCAQVAHFAVDIAVAEASETAASVAAPARAAAEEFFASDCRSSVDECVTFTTALGAAAGRIFQQADKLGYDLMCKTLAVGGMSPDVDAIGGEPLLAAVAADGRLQTVRFLIGADANVNRQSGGLFGWAALHSAASAGHLHVVEELLKAGAAVDLRDTMEQTPLMLSAVHGHELVVAALLSAGADINAKDKDGRSALDIARGPAAFGADPAGVVGVRARLEAAALARVATAASTADSRERP